MRRVMAQIDSTKLPDELIHIEICTQVPVSDGLANELRQQAAPLAFHGENLIPDRPFHVVELE